ncbi:MAG: hypothetical protein KAS94_07260 [Desulfobulbaceae bacterium]|nr:hypothetical protein [Desulfobulbaceae bacterium]
MKKLTTVLGLFFCLGLLVNPSGAKAGTYFTGAKGWYASWDSGILNWFEEDLAHSFLANRLTLTADSDPGDGYLLGPLFGYMTDDGKWSFSFAPMIISDFSQDWHGMAGPMALNTTVDLTRHDFDFAASMKLSDNYKMFFGYKYQDMKMDFNLSYEVMSDPQNFLYCIESQVHIPTVGISGVYQFGSSLVAGGQVGLLYTFPSLEITSAGVTEDIRPWNSFGFNLEASLTYRPATDVLLQVGYRYQVFEFEARAPGSYNDISSYDITHGLTLTGVYLF